MPDLVALVVEDDVDIQRLLALRLRRLGLDVRIASTGEEAIQLAAERRPDVALVDLNLPGIDGREVIRHLRGGVVTATLPILVVSIEDPHPAVRVDGWLVKPFSGRAVDREVRRLLGSARPLGAGVPGP